MGKTWSMSTDPTWTTIVVGYDGSEPSQEALARAAGLAERPDGKLVVVTVAAPNMPAEPLTLDPLGPMPVGGAPLGPALGQSGQDPWAELLERARGFLSGSGIAAEFVSPAGDPERELIEVAEEHGADLIVVGAHDRGLLERLVAPSVSGAVARRARCDVLVVHAPKDASSS
jgi:nucleotide-binding universal stress UspA family protein